MDNNSNTFTQLAENLPWFVEIASFSKMASNLSPQRQPILGLFGLTQ